MERLHYAGNSVLTGSDIAHALLGYARALAANEASDTLSIPILNEDGTETTAELLIGPASQLISETVESDRADPIDTELVTRIKTATRALDAPRPVATDDYDEAQFPDFGEL